MDGSESSRAAAKYKADRALFLLLLSAPYQSIRLSRAIPPQPTLSGLYSVLPFSPFRIRLGFQKFG